MTAAKRGRKPLPREGTFDRLDHDRKYYGRIDDFVTEHIARDPTARGRVERAMAAALERFGYRDRTSVQRILAKFEPWREAHRKTVPIFAKFNRVAGPALKFIRLQFNEAERAELKGVGWPFVLELALDRAELKWRRAAASRNSRK